MATIVQNPPTHPADRLRPGMSAGGGLPKGPGGDPPSEQNLRALLDPSGEPVRTGVWVALAAIAMMFVAFTSALFVREGSSSTDWHHLAIPKILYLNSLLLVASSITLEVARRRVAAFARGLVDDSAEPLRWLYATLALGLLFVAGQYQAWLGLRAQGVYLASNPNSSFFYVLTAVHAVHVLGGLGGLLYVIYKLDRPVLALRRSTLDSTSYYWHFMGALWIYLLVIIWIKL
jgi:cytochrome c oxidase subunit III